MIASSRKRIIRPVRTIGPTADGTTSGSTYNEYHVVRPRLLPRSLESPSHTEKAIGVNSPGEKETPDCDWRGRASLSRPESRSEEHTSELQSHSDLVCRLLP